MAADKPLWWKVFDRAERAVAPRLESVVASGAFLDGLGLAARAQARARRLVEARARAVWHLVNLPAGSDVARLRREVAALDRELRRMASILERATAGHPAQEETHADDPRAAANGRAPRAGRTAGPRAPGRRAQRPPGP